MGMTTKGDLGPAPEAWTLLPSRLTASQMSQLRQMKRAKLIEYDTVPFASPAYVGIKWRKAVKRRRQE
ncbi:MAG: hypothetical protein EOR43_28785 [Mesorhizobium sp.]|uniref:hypothetical protein n=1 Tax=Mesorhizobium sp. TaxID=1871066 RepID=UPI000FE31D8C|nr:hypothetical protein [Mesorhizobium sp.]RWK17043.1 MAG: hypothetical protein EOR43_28785 [Mesorhizobium sp.]RWK27350.1 MAG: hypothetical protein EOR44_27765 [Mesorhizobium sp.]